MIGSKKMLLHFFSLINYSLLEFIASTSIINFTYTVNTVYFLKQWLFFFIYIKQLIKLSKRKSKENCLEDCQWSKVDKCIDCPDGFYGINCSRQCRYPNYGKDCQQDCSHCNREICNSTVGCLTQDGAIERGTYEL